MTADTEGNGDWMRRVGVRRLRLVSGLILFTYVTLHFLNHATGNVSIATMDAVVLWQIEIWQSWPGSIALYGAITGHITLGLWAFYERRHHAWTRGEIWQLVLSLSIPPLLMSHVIGERLSQTLFGTTIGYAEELAKFWVVDPVHGVQQAVVLLIAWIHGCIGIFYWLRLKRWFPGVAPILLGAAVALPLLALLGFFAGRREVLTAFNDPRWRALHWVPALIGTPEQMAALARIKQVILGCYLGLLGIVLLARGVRSWREHRGAGISVTYPGGRLVRVPRGYSVLEASFAAGVPHASVCGGRGRCSTCRIRVVAGEQFLAAPDAVEAAVLQRIAAGPSVRLACQSRPDGNLSVVPLLPAHSTPAAVGTRVVSRGGEERFIVIMVVDMRNSTGMAENRMPFDAVFLIDRFVDAVGRAIKDAGGRPNQFTGDGVFALFGVETGPDTACRQALVAVAAIGRNVDALNAALPGAPVRFGIGVHGGTAVVGEIGFDQSRIFTALGDPANVASRLEKLCKSYGAEAVVSDDVCRAGGLATSAFPRETAELAGRISRLDVRVIARAAALSVELSPAHPPE